jgi:hypothetical protein
MICDLREIFPILENLDGSGFGLTRVVEGQAASSVSGAAPVLAFKDANGNLVFPALDSQGRLPVTTGGAGILVRARGQLDCGNATTGMILVTGAQVSLTNGKQYYGDSFVVSCFREAHAQLVWVDNGVDNILEDILLGPGQYTMQIDLPGDGFTAGSGTQTLEVRARNTTNAASAIRASVVVTAMP